MKRILAIMFSGLPRAAYMPIFGIPILSVACLCALLTGCPSQNTTAALVGVAGTAIASLETLEGHTEAAAKIQTDFAAAQTAVLNWKAGTPTQDVAQALALVESDLNLLPVSVQDQAYITLAIGTVQSVLDLFPAAQGSGITSNVRHADVNTFVAPKTVDEFKARWNGIGGIASPLK